ncbi:MAG: hypothetical protein AAF990_14295 [Bacteroidota bacterium]
MKLINLLCYCLLLWVGLSSLPVAAQSDAPDAGPLQQQWLLNLLGPELDSSQLDFLQTEGLLENISLDELMPFHELSDFITLPQGPNRQKIAIIRPQLTAQLFYSDQLTLDSTDALQPTFFKGLQFQSGFQFNGLPVMLNARAVWTDFKFQQKMSAFSFAFDHRKFLDRYRSSFDLDLDKITSTAIPELPGDLSAPVAPSGEQVNGLKGYLDWTDADMALIRKEMKFLLYQKIISDSTFDQLSQARQLSPDLLRDSMQSYAAELAHEQLPQEQTDSLLIARKTQLTNAQQKLEERKNKSVEIVQKYRQSWADRKAYYGDSLAQTRARLMQKLELMEDYKNPKAIQERLRRDKRLKWTERFLAASDKFQIGRSVVSDSWYTAKNLPINGLHYGFTSGRLSGEMAVGRQVFNNQFSPLWSSALFNQLRGGQVLFAKASYRVTDYSQIDYSFIRLREKGQFSPGLILAPQNNVVFMLSGQTRLLQDVQLKSEIGFSRSVWGRPDLSVDNQVNARNMVSESTLTAELFEQKLELEVGYFYIGPDFIAAGNPFLQNNRQGLVARAKSRLHAKLELETEVRFGHSIEDESLQGGRQKNLQLIGTLNWQVHKYLQLSAQMAPNYFRQSGQGDLAISNDNMLYNVFLSAHRILDGQVLQLSAGVTNYSSELQFVDSSWINTTTQLYLQPSWQFTKQSSISALCLWGINAGQGVELEDNSFLGQLEYAWQSERWQSSFGLQLLNDPLDESWYYGLTTLAAIHLGQKLQLALNASWQLPLQSGERKQQQRFWTQLEVTQQF